MVQQQAYLGRRIVRLCLVHSKLLFLGFGIGGLIATLALSVIFKEPLLVVRHGFVGSGETNGLKGSVRGSAPTMVR